jgi:hypothetical protein
VSHRRTFDRVLPLQVEQWLKILLSCASPFHPDRAFPPQVDLGHLCIWIDISAYIMLSTTCVPSGDPLGYVTQYCCIFNASDL